MTEPSPFLPGTKVQFAWDSTSLGWLKTCPRLYQYSMIDQWRSRGNSVHLDFGLWYHHGLESYDRRRAEGMNHDDALADVVLDLLTLTWVYPSTEGLDLDTSAGMSAANMAEGSPWDSGHNLKTRETLIRSVIWYVEQFGDDDAAQTVVLANGKPAVELSFKMEMDWGPKAQQSVGYDKVVGQPYILSGHLDRLVNFNDGVYVMDRKTSSTTIGSYYFENYSPDNQMSLYSMAAKVIYNTPVKGIIIDAAQIAVGFTRFSRGFTFRTPAQIDEWLDDTKRWLALAEQFAVADFWPMNDKSCHQYGGCAFRKVCSKSPEVRQKFLESDFTKKEWNPLIPR